MKDGGFTKRVELKRASSGPDLSICYISQDWGTSSCINLFGGIIIISEKKSQFCLQIADAECV